MCDWNRNGKFDWQDAWISYHINKSISGESENDNTPSSGNDAVVFIGVILLVLGILILFV